MSRIDIMLGNVDLNAPNQRYRVIKGEVAKIGVVLAKKMGEWLRDKSHSQ